MTSSTGQRIKPFVNWAGGKTKALSQILPLFPSTGTYGRYIEPFIGGGSVFLAFCPNLAILSDSNSELINAYIAVRDDVDQLIEHLSRFPRDKDLYYELREVDPTTIDPVPRAARFIYLNKVAFNGMYRVNLKGKFNVPFGNRKAKIFDAANLREVSHRLRGANIASQDHSVTLSQARAGDFVYLDPPYHPSSRTSCFTKYTQNPFGEIAQLELAARFKALTNRGVKVALSNSDTELIRGLYEGYKKYSILTRRYVNANGNGRASLSDLLIINY